MREQRLSPLGEVAEIASQLLPVGLVVTDPSLQVLLELLVETLVVILVLGKLLDQFHDLLNQALSDVPQAFS